MKKITHYLRNKTFQMKFKAEIYVNYKAPDYVRTEISVQETDLSKTIKTKKCKENFRWMDNKNSKKTTKCRNYL